MAQDKQVAVWDWIIAELEEEHREIYGEEISEEDLKYRVNDLLADALYEYEFTIDMVEAGSSKSV